MENGSYNNYAVTFGDTSQNSLYQLLTLYYLEDLWSPPIYNEIMESEDPQQYIMDYFAAKLQWDRKLQAIIAAASEKVEA